MPTTETKRDKRKNKTAEVFTPPFLVNDMLNKLPTELFTEEGKTFCDPAVGNGNFLVEILQRKLDNGHDPLKALQSLYGVDIMQDNIRECRWRLLSIVAKLHPITDKMVYAVMRNIVWLSLKSYPTGSLEYDFEFSNGIKDRDVKRWMQQIKDGKLEEFSEELPVIEGNTKEKSPKKVAKKEKEQHNRDIDEILGSMMGRC